MGFFKRRKKDQANDSEESTVAVASKDDELRDEPGSKLFGRGGKSNRKDKSKGKLFGGSKQEMTLVERMQLVESVAAASLQVINELVSIGDSAVREVDDGLLIVVITNDMLVASGVDPSDEEFGSFAEALISESIESMTLEDDLANGIIGIIPSMDTLISLDEFDFIHDMPLQWAIVPFDLTDDSRLVLLDSTVHLDRLIEIAKSPSIELYVEGNEVVDSGDGERTWQNESSDHSHDDEDSEDYEVELDDESEALDDTYTSSEQTDYGAYDVFSAENNNASDISEVGFGSEFFGGDTFSEGSFNEFSSEEDDLDPDQEDEMLYGMNDEEEEALDVGDGYSLNSSVVQSDMTVEESKSIVTKALEHSFNNTELNLTIDLTKFDDYFGTLSVVKFDEKATDDSELQRVVSNFRKDANVEIEKYHEIEIAGLRNTFITSLRSLHSQLLTTLDHNDRGTLYGGRFSEIDAVFDDAMSDMDRLSANEVKNIHEAYNIDRETYGENAKREAMTIYDTRYRDERNRKIEGVKDSLKTEMKLNRDVARGELYNDRRIVAASLFDKAITALLQSLQEEYQTIMEKELHMYDTFRKNIDMYLREHFADEVLRAKAEAERLKQNEEADHIRRGYEQMLATKSQMLEEADQQAKIAIQQLERKHKDQLNELRADYERNIDREKQENEKLQGLLEKVTESNTQIGDKKELEIKHRIKVYENQIESQKQELAYANDRSGKEQKQLTLVYIAIGAAALAIGVLFGFVFGANSAQQQAPAAPAAQTQPVSTIERAVVPSIGMEPINGSAA
ncbi:hypothetical protein [Paenibacillus amylolyticus]|uniref:hypothetical protein n=1 Tax=Paenibacillus amylolyticus TaxID=1451 RepID=UPI00201DDAF2|nr:hypothetical protein [Paenibacillus amylolyticus]MCL6663435.1 hypothetical protein [Paenibacillus amylolyticus]